METTNSKPDGYFYKLIIYVTSALGHTEAFMPNTEH